MKITLEELAETTKCTKGEISTDFDEADKNGKTLYFINIYIPNLICYSDHFFDSSYYLHNNETQISQQASERRVLLQKLLNTIQHVYLYFFIFAIHLFFE